MLPAGETHGEKYLPMMRIVRFCIPGRTRGIIGNCATTSPATHGTLAIVANGSYELPEPGTSYKPDFGHEKGDLRPQNTFHCAISFCKSKSRLIRPGYPDKAAH
jgi:hypothetical protein